MQKYIEKIICHKQVIFISEMQGSFNKCKSINEINHINNFYYRNCLIISIETQNALGKIQGHFKLKTLERLRIEETFINIIKTVCDKPEANIIINGKNSKHSHQNQKTRQSTLQMMIQFCSWNPWQLKKTRKKKQNRCKREIRK